MASALLLSITAAVVLSGCGTFSGLLKSDGAGTLGATSEPAAPATVAAVETPEPTTSAATPIAPTAISRGVSELDASPTPLTRLPSPRRPSRHGPRCCWNGSGRRVTSPPTLRPSSWHPIGAGSPPTERHGCLNTSGW